jgi:hypothetical protein
MQLDEPIKDKIKHNDTLIVDIRNPTTTTVTTPTTSTSTTTTNSPPSNINQSEIVYIGEENQRKRKIENISQGGAEAKDQKKLKASNTATTTTTNRIHTLFDSPTRSSTEERIKGIQISTVDSVLIF